MTREMSGICSSFLQDNYPQNKIQIIYRFTLCINTLLRVTPESMLTGMRNDTQRICTGLSLTRRLIGDTRGGWANGRICWAY